MYKDEDLCDKKQLKDGEDNFEKALKNYNQNKLINEKFFIEPSLTKSNVETVS